MERPPSQSHSHTHKARKEPPRERSYDGDAFVKLFGHRGARDIIVLDAEGKPLRSTVSFRRAMAYASHLKPLTSMARNVVRDLDPSNDVTFMRMRSEIREVLIALSADFILIVVQNLQHRKVIEMNTVKD